MNNDEVKETLENLETEASETVEQFDEETVVDADLMERIRANEEKFGKTKWYALHTFSGYENVAKENLETVISKFNLQDRIFDIIIPMESVVEEKKGKKVLVERKSMPCYIFVKMIYGDDLWHNVTNTRGITGFVGPNGRALPLTDEDVRRNKLEVIKISVNVEKGDKVEIIDGPLEGTIGTVSSVAPETNTAVVMVEMFGREAPVELELSQMRKVEL